MVLNLEEEGSGSLKRAREAVAAAAAEEDLAQGPGQDRVHGVPVGLALAPGPAQSLATDRGGLQTRIAPGLDPGLEPGGPGAAAAAAPKDDAKCWAARIQDVAWRLGFPFSVTDP